MKFQIRFKTSSKSFSGEPRWSFAIIPQESWGTCSYCKTFPFCILLRNSGKRYKTCPCQNCMVQMMCTKQCDMFKKEVHSLFGLKSTTDYKHYWYSILDKD